MKVKSDIPGFENKIHAKVERVARPLYRDQVRAAVPVRTGALRTAVTTTFEKLGQSHSRVTVSSAKRYGRAVEYGANVGPRRGPHMRGDHAVEQVTRARWGSVVTQALREPL